MGEGIKDGRELLVAQGRDGAVPTMIVMTDGNTNKSPDGWSLPAGWNWADYTDMDGDGSADYTTNDEDKQYAFYQSKLAIDEGFTIHTMTVEMVRIQISWKPLLSLETVRDQCHTGWLDRESSNQAGRCVLAFGGRRFHRPNWLGLSETGSPDFIGTILRKTARTDECQSGFSF